MTPLRPLLPMLLAAASLAGAAAAVAAEDPLAGTRSVYLQRSASGRAMLSDKPLPGVVVERMWQMEREDPEAARQRAQDVKFESAATTLRVQRTIDAFQERQVLADRERTRLVVAESERRRLLDEQAASRPLVVYPWLGGYPPGARPPRGPRDRFEPPRQRPPRHGLQSREPALNDARDPRR